MNGWIKTYRKLSEWEWYKDSHMVHLFIHLLIMANHEDKKWRGLTLKRGQLVTSRNILSAQTGISDRSIRTCLERLKSTNELTIQSSNKNSIITICNYDNYQSREDMSDQQNDQQTRQQATIKRPTIKQELKEDKKKRKESTTTVVDEKSASPDFLKFNLWLAKNAPYCANPKNFEKQISEENFFRLKEKYNGEQIAFIIGQIENRKDLRKRYTDLYRTVLNWAKKEYANG
ncbi:MAG TPA: hypothetical protein DDW85_02270 [Porphyromonadaceae bacterium]|nr:hypothetical protein [Porphyromonadaceae bacterium]